MPFLWQIYMDNVDPFMKVLHVPTMTKVVREVGGGHQSLGLSMQALVLVTALAAIMSLEDKEVSDCDLRFDMFWLTHSSKGAGEFQHRQGSTRCSLSPWH